MPIHAQARRLILLLAALTALVAAAGAGLMLAPAAHASSAQNRVRAFTPAAELPAKGQASGSACSRPGSSATNAQIASGFCVAAEEGGGFISRLGARLADETGAVGRYGNLGNLAGRADETLADVIRSRGGGASQINQLQTGYGELTLGEISDLAASGNREAIRAIKMAKQAGSQGKGGY